LQSPATQNVPVPQGVLASQLPCALQACDSFGASGLQRRVSRTHSPVHSSSMHENGHSVSSTNAPMTHRWSDRSPLHW
jgi:hypothetical protein